MDTYQTQAQIQIYSPGNPAHDPSPQVSFYPKPCKVTFGKEYFLKCLFKND
jgi:hypothetical protein